MKVVLSNILVKEIKEDVKSSGGIILGDGSDIKFRKGVIKSVGENIDKVKPGDVIHFDRHRIYPINYEGEEFLVMNYENIVIVED
jgi:co-chaperonin GroES (HSP10)